jgi:hypothetical protein
VPPSSGKGVGEKEAEGVVATVLTNPKAKLTTKDVETFNTQYPLTRGLAHDDLPRPFPHMLVVQTKT